MLGPFTWRDGYHRRHVVGLARFLVFGVHEGACMVVGVALVVFVTDRQLLCRSRCHPARKRNRSLPNMAAGDSYWRGTHDCRGIEMGGSVVLSGR
jgi:hypothetical protein